MLRVWEVSRNDLGSTVSVTAAGQGTVKTVVVLCICKQLALFDVCPASTNTFLPITEEVP